MNVPQHISVDGDETIHRQRPRSITDGSDLAYQMNVPERILVAGGDKIVSERAPPPELIADRLLSIYPTEVNLFKLENDF